MGAAVVLPLRLGSMVGGKHVGICELAAIGCMCDGVLGVSGYKHCPGLARDASKRLFVGGVLLGCKLQRDVVGQH